MITLTDEDRNRFSNQILLDQIGLSGQQKLKSAKVLCVGAGGLASSALLYLSGLGIGTLGIVDDDRVELKNLPRQIAFEEADLKVSKVVALEKKLKERNHTTHINTYNVKLNCDNAKNIIGQYDIIVDTTDNFPSKYLINDTCCLLEKPLVTASAEGFIGYCTVILPPTSACLRCLFPYFDANEPESNISACQEIGILATVTGILGCIQANEVVKIILNMEESLANNLFSFDSLKTEFKKYRYKKSIKCPICYSKKDDQHDDQIILDQTCITYDQFKQFNASKVMLIKVDEDPILVCKDHVVKKFISFYELQSDLKNIASDTSIIFYCKSDYNSRQAAYRLISKGYQNVFYLANGVESVRQYQAELK